MQSFKPAKASSANIAKSVFNLIKDDMKLVEAEFENQTKSNIQVVNYLGEYLRASGGKRLRPALLILAYRALGNTDVNENTIRVATVMEMLHTATLVHDDIIDNAVTRRNQASINARFGNQTAVLMGDWLYMSAFETSLRERSLEILDILTELTRKMTEGELLQLTMLGRTDISEAEYFDILQRKTAFLFSACCEIGAILGGATDEQKKAFREYGRNLGIAFQLADDLLDFTADKKVIGKASGTDLLEGKLTLPLILLSDADPAVSQELQSIMREGVYPNGSRADLLNKLKTHGILEETRAVAYDFCGSAKKNLEVLPKTEYRLALEEIPTYMIERNK
ncbi:MAG: polyprenyl synthetase family protein [Pyrinomonadaceae bacterium]